MKLKDLVMKKPGTEVLCLSQQAKDGFQAIDQLITERNALAVDVKSQSDVISRLTIENEHLRSINAELQNQRDFWMRTHARIESNLSQLGAVVQTLYREFQTSPRAEGEVKQIAERFSPERKDAKSVA